jgi:enolase-phosphatase E1
LAVIRLSRDSVDGFLLDVEGTTTPVAFVYSTLFPYARRNLPSFIASHRLDPGLRSDLDRLERERSQDMAEGRDPPDSPAAYLEWLMDRDRKSTALKSIQGRIWEAGYRSGELRGAVFGDVGPALERWSQEGFWIRIFSSGSVLAQKLLFGYSTAGDLRRFVSDCFDTTTGGKKDPDSYSRIARAAGSSPESILFVSDSVEELAAARSAGFRTALSMREGNAAPPPGHEVYDAVRSFDEIKVR